MKKGILRSIPVTSLRKQMLTGVVIGSVVFFILMVFQPFGTFTFRMNHKTLFLAGYGIICSLTYSFYYFILMTVIKRWFVPQRWTMIREIITLIPVLLIMAVVSLFYHHSVIGGYEIHLSDIRYFIRISMAVASIPIVILLYSKWLKSNLTTISKSESEPEADYDITFDSNNKNDKPMTVSSTCLLYVKSSGNYIEVARMQEGVVRKSLLRNALNQVESILPADDFIKIHRSYIVNVRSIETMVLVGSSYSVKLRDTDLQLPVSRSMISRVKEICLQ